MQYLWYSSNLNERNPNVTDYNGHEKLKGVLKTHLCAIIVPNWITHIASTANSSLFFNYICFHLVFPGVRDDRTSETEIPSHSAPIFSITVSSSPRLHNSSTTTYLCPSVHISRCFFFFPPIVFRRYRRIWRHGGGQECVRRGEQQHVPGV